MSLMNKAVRAARQANSSRRPVVGRSAGRGRRRDSIDRVADGVKRRTGNKHGGLIDTVAGVVRSQQGSRRR